MKSVEIKTPKKWKEHRLNWENEKVPKSKDNKKKKKSKKSTRSFSQTIFKQLCSLKMIITTIISIVIFLNSAAVWGINFAASQFSFFSMLSIGRSTAVENIVNGCDSYLGKVVTAIQNTHQNLLWSHLKGYNYTSNFTDYTGQVTMLLHSNLINTQLKELYFGTESGSVIGIDTYSEGQRRFMSTGIEHEGEDIITLRFSHVNNESGIVEESSILNTLNDGYFDSYDPRIRSWYTEAKDTDDLGWVDIYPTALDPPVLMTSAYKRFVDQYGEFKAVVSASVSLDLLNNFLKGLNLDYLVFLVQENGDLFASNADQTEQEQYSITKCAQSSVSSIKEVSNHLLNVFSNYQSIGNYSGQIIDTNGLLLLIETKKVNVQGLEVVIVLVVDYYNTYNEDLLSRILNLSSFGISALLLVIGAIGTFLLGVYITNILKKQATRMYKVSKLDFKKETITKKQKKLQIFDLLEIRRMNQAMDLMIEGLDMFSRFLPHYVLKNLVSKDFKRNKSVNARRTSILFIDIESFTSISEQSKPIELLKTLEIFFDKVENRIRKNKGIVDKHIGDCCMGIFNPFGMNMEKHSLQACKAALEMIEDCTKVYLKTKDGKKIQMKSRVGINSSYTLVGIIGSENRKTFSAIGGGVCDAAKFEQLNKNYGTTIMIGETAYQSVKKDLLCKWCDHIKLTSKKKEKNVYEVVGILKGASENDLEEAKNLQVIKTLIRTGEYKEAQTILEHNFAKSENQKRVSVLLKKIKRKALNQEVKKNSISL